MKKTRMIRLWDYVKQQKKMLKKIIARKHEDISYIGRGLTSPAGFVFDVAGYGITRFSTTMEFTPDCRKRIARTIRSICRIDPVASVIVDRQETTSHITHKGRKKALKRQLHSRGVFELKAIAFCKQPPEPFILKRANRSLRGYSHISSTTLPWKPVRHATLQHLSEYNHKRLQALVNKYHLNLTFVVTPNPSGQTPSIESIDTIIIKMPPKKVEVFNKDYGGQTFEITYIISQDDHVRTRVNGIWIPRKFVEQPERISAKDIQQESNMECKRLLLDMMGVEKFVEEAGLHTVDRISENNNQLPVGLRGARLMIAADDLQKDSHGVPRPLLRLGSWDAPIVVLEVINSTAEPDGSFRKYHFTIDSTCYDGEAAVNVVAAAASTWRKRSDPDELFFKSPSDYLLLARES